MREAIPFIGLAALLAALPVTALGYKEGPLPAMTGGFGEKTCHTCHFDNPINDRAGSLHVEGVPLKYTPGQQYELTVVVRRAGIKRAGFELAARFSEGSARGRQAGTLRPADQRTQMTSVPGESVLYIQHNKAGSDLAGPDQGRWRVYWTAPSAAARVVFHVAGNAANDDASPLGDFIYTTSVASRPAATREPWTDLLRQRHP